MELHFTGIIIAVSTFLIIGLFHPIVIKTEYYTGTRYWWVFLVLGFATIAAAFLIEDVLLSAIHGILGASSLWSIGELFEQKQRCEKGWFPKNPKRIGKGYYKDEVKDEERKHVIAGIKDYAERITHYMPFTITTIPELKNTKSLSEQQQKEREGELILKQLQPSDTVVLMDEHGLEFRSIEFAKWIERKQATSRRLVFVIGGPYGFSQAVYDRANEKISLSKMTFSHQMVRLIFTEALYRACTIIKGEPYHHE